jgi:hypothetical protein
MARSENRNAESNGSDVRKPKVPTLRRMLRNRRSLSAPPTTGRRLIEDHYCVDTTRSVVLPGVPKHEDDWARDAHDFFNLVVLVGVHFVLQFVDSHEQIANNSFA